MTRQHANEKQAHADQAPLKRPMVHAAACATDEATFRAPTTDEATSTTPVIRPHKPASQSRRSSPIPQIAPSLESYPSISYRTNTDPTDVSTQLLEKVCTIRKNACDIWKMSMKFKKMCVTLFDNVIFPPSENTCRRNGCI